MSNRRPKGTFTRIAIAVPIVIALCLVAAFVWTYSHTSSDGDRLNAFGAVVGGMIGALGSAVAVYLTLWGLRQDETETVRDSANREVQDFCRTACRNLGICMDIADGFVRIPRRELTTIMQVRRPAIYEAIAGRIGRLHHAQGYVTFYGRIAEIEQIIAVISGRTNDHTDLLTPFHPEILDAEEIAPVAQAWIDICEFGQLLMDPKSQDNSFDDVATSKHFQSNLKKTLERVQKTFPELRRPTD